MFGAIYIGLSGMQAYSKGLQTISNNVANLNSPGFKASTATFSDAFNYGGSGMTLSSGTNSEQAGAGVRFSSPQTDFRQGDLRQSNGDLDLAIQGAGFLVLLDGDKTAYARTGQFSVNDKGYIVLQGTDSRLATLDESGKAVALTIDGERTQKPVATTRITFSDNLSSGSFSATVSDIAVYDSLGGKHTWQVRFSRPETSTTLDWAVTVTDQTGRTVGTSTLKFIGGVVDPTTETLTITDTPPNAAPMSVVLDFSKEVDGFSTGTSSTIRASAVDGNGASALSSVTIDDAGKVKLTYADKNTKLIGAVALADFRDPQALQRVGNGLFVNQGGERPRLLASAADGIGKLVSRQVEASNVDLSQEFGDLILVQRGFQASSQVVSASNEMIQQLFGIRGQG